jgi:capsular polysaccharide biosynthesis protein
MTDDHFRTRTKRYASVVMRWLAVVALVFVATMAGGIYMTNHVLAKIYSATASMQLQVPIPGAQTYSGWAFSSPQSRAVKAEFESIESPDILRGVISTQNLDQTWADRIFKQADPLTTEEALHYLASHLKLTFKHESNIVEVTVLSDEPREAARIANGIVELYKQTRDGQPGEVTGAAPNAGMVAIIGRAVIPEEPTYPNKRFCYALSAGLAGLLSVMVASLIEVGLLITRAEAASQEMLAGKRR